MAQASDLYVICHATVVMPRGGIRDMFIGERLFAGTFKLLPADNAAAQPVFLERVLMVNAEKYAVIWTRKSFRDGANPPAVKASDAEALAYVKATPGACSYTLSPPDREVTVVGIF